MEKKAIFQKKVVSEWSDWHWQMANALRTPEDFKECFGLDEAFVAGIRRVAERYPMFATPHYASLIRRADFSDAVFAQCFASEREMEGVGQCSPDPLGEGASSPLPRLVHRYRDRALFLTCGLCAVHCRHCMRKRVWDTPLAAPSDEELAQAVDYLRKHPDVRELLISGGDPLMLADGQIERVLRAFSQVESLEMLRIGSRTLVALPQRITRSLCQVLESIPKTVWVATHFNHPDEISEEAAQAVKRLMAAGVPVVNQSVLLKGINDDSSILGKLFTQLLAIRIKPYYLFHGDPVEGTTCFRTGVEAGLKIMEELRRNISGMAVPVFAFDLPNGGGKIRLEPDFSMGKADDGSTIYRRFDSGTEKY